MNGGDDYEYDSNGNLVQDNNKNISSIAYNYLNLPTLITMTNKGTISYTYDAAGNKLKKTVYESSISKTTVTLYHGNIVYQNDSLQFVSNEEGRARKNSSGTLVYDYFLKDHLGNVRMMITDDETATSPVLESTSYYPFGLTMAGISTKFLNKLQNRLKFNGGNELQSVEFNDGSGLELYDAHFRLLDPQIGRFIQQDEISDANWNINPYNFAINNPIIFNDPLGLKEGPSFVKTLEEVVVSVRKNYTHDQLQDIYWQLRDQNISFLRVKDDKLRHRLYMWDGVQRHMDRVHELTRQQDIVFLMVASTLVPAGNLMKLRYLEYAADIFKMKRALRYTAGLVDLTSQLFANRGEIGKVNLISIASSFSINNPILSAIPGSVFSFQFNTGFKKNSLSSPEVYENIIFSAAGNYFGSKSGEILGQIRDIRFPIFIGGAMTSSSITVLREIPNQNQNK